MTESRFHWYQHGAGLLWLHETLAKMYQDMYGWHLVQLDDDQVNAAIAEAKSMNFATTEETKQYFINKLTQQ